MHSLALLLRGMLMSESLAEPAPGQRLAELPLLFLQLRVRDFHQLSVLHLPQAGMDTHCSIRATHLLHALQHATSAGCCCNTASASASDSVRRLEVAIDRIELLSSSRHMRSKLAKLCPSRLRNALLSLHTHTPQSIVASDYQRE